MIRSGRLRGRWQQDAGALTLTYVVVLPCVLLFIMVMVQASFWFLARDAALAAARQGADAARAYGASPSAGSAAAMAFARQAGDGYLLDPNVRVRDMDGATISIKVSGHVPTFVPGVVVGVAETVQAPVERFRS